MRQVGFKIYPFKFNRAIKVRGIKVSVRVNKAKSNQDTFFSSCKPYSVLAFKEK